MFILTKTKTQTLQKIFTRFRQLRNTWKFFKTEFICEINGVLHHSVDNLLADRPDSLNLN